MSYEQSLIGAIDHEIAIHREIMDSHIAYPKDYHEGAIVGLEAAKDIVNRLLRTPNMDGLVAKLESLQEYPYGGTDLVHKYAVIETVTNHFAESKAE